MRRSVSLILAIILLITCSGCFWGYDRGGHNDQNSRGYGDQNSRGYGDQNSRGYGDQNSRGYEERH
jgi:hypothetical protein